MNRQCSVIEKYVIPIKRDEKIDITYRNMVTSSKL